MLNAYTLQLYYTKVSRNTENESEIQLFPQSQKVVTGIFTLCTQDTQEPYVECQSQNTAATGYQKQKYYRIS